MKLEVTFGEILRTQRLAKNLSQVEFAERSQLDRTFISLVERGIRQPTLKSLFQIAAGLDMLPSELLVFVEKSVRRSRWKRLRG